MIPLKAPYYVENQATLESDRFFDGSFIESSNWDTRDLADELLQRLLVTQKRFFSREELADVGASSPCKCPARCKPSALSPI